MVFAKLKNFFVKLIFFNLAKKFFNLAKKVGPNLDYLFHV
jgi:hypothetical protein